jgi:hypothetical protein
MVKKEFGFLYYVPGYVDSGIGNDNKMQTDQVAVLIYETTNQTEDHRFESCHAVIFLGKPVISNLILLLMCICAKEI